MVWNHKYCTHRWLYFDCIVKYFNSCSKHIIIKRFDTIFIHYLGKGIFWNQLKDLSLVRCRINMLSNHFDVSESMKPKLEDYKENLSYIYINE